MSEASAATTGKIGSVSRLLPFGVSGKARGPVPFGNIGKSVQDLLYKDYNFDHKFLISTVSDYGLGVTSTGIKIGENFVGDISTKLKSGRTHVDLKINTASTVSTTINIEEVLTGLKATINFKIPDQRSGKLDLLYVRDNMTVNSSIGLTSMPLLQLAATMGSREITVGAEIGFDTNSVTFSKCNCGIGYNKHDFAASLFMENKGKNVRASYIQAIGQSNALAVEMTHKIGTYDNHFTVGSYHALSPKTVVKMRFSNTGKTSLLCQHNMSATSSLTLSAEYDTKAVSAPAKMGLTVALKP